MFLICHVIPKRPRFKGLFDFMDESPSYKLSQHLAMCNGQKFCGSRDTTYLICHVNSGDHVFKGLCGFLRGSLFQ